MLFLSLVSSAHAVIYGGNPELTVWADRAQHDMIDGYVKLGKVRMNVCNSSPVDYVVNADIDPVAGYTLGIAAGDYCGATFFWDTNMTIDGGTGTGWGIEYTPNSNYLPIATMVAPLTPFNLLYGVIYGGNPELHMSID